MYPRLRIIRIALGVLLLTPCLSVSAAEAIKDSVPASMYGLWRSEGYNNLIHIAFDVTEYKVTEADTVFSRRLAQKDFLGDSGITPEGPDRFSITAGLPEYRYYYRRVQALPGSARYFGRGESAESRDAVVNFDVFWDAFNENYAYFDVRKMDWNAVRTQWRPRIQADNTAAGLETALTAIVRQLGDHHVMVTVPGVKRLQADAKPLESAAAWLRTEQRRNPQAKASDFRPTMDKYVAEQVLGGRGQESTDGRLIWGLLDNGVGYLGFRSCSSSMEELNSALDQAMAVLSQAPAVVVDLRTNGGGSDAVALAVVARFTDQQRVAFTKQVKIGDRLGEAQPITIRPAEGRVPYLKPTYVLTTDTTASAAEIGAMGFRVLPHVTLAGAPTQGILSDMLGGRLPNSWTYTLSNEVYIAADGQSYESRGIPPALALPYEVKGDFYQAFDAALATASARALKQAR